MGAGEVSVFPASYAAPQMSRQSYHSSKVSETGGLHLLGLSVKLDVHFKEGCKRFTPVGLSFCNRKSVLQRVRARCNARSVAVVFEVSCYAGKPSAAWRVAGGDILIDASSSRPFSTFCPATQSGEEVSGGRALVS